jgi:hypothetical protein
MKTTFTFPTILALALPLALLAQNKSEPNTPAGASRGRQVIINKLESIRLDTVRYDGLPLGEVVINLRDEAKKRDPEKKGVNFLINQNLDPGEAAVIPAPAVGPDGNFLPSPPAEQVDLSTVCIKINLPLTDVRLVDVLDAVVKVADHPIKYSVEDYGVVFSPRGVESARNEASGFAFPGGTPGLFLNAVQEQYKVDWSSVSDIPKEMADVHIPRLRISQTYSFAATGLSREEYGNESLKQLLSLYNQLGEQRPELGRLVVKGDLTKPSVVMFVPDKAATDAQPKVKVKAFSILGLSDAQRVKLQEDIRGAKEEALEYASRLHSSSSLQSMVGIVWMHNDTSLLVATGSESFVDMVESIVTASQASEARERAGKPAAPTALPNAPGK